MEAVENIIETPAARRGKLLKILGVTFGLAVGIGATVGVGILRNPGGVAAQLASPWLIMTAWFLGGIYCLLGAFGGQNGSGEAAQTSAAITTPVSFLASLVAFVLAFQLILGTYEGLSEILCFPVLSANFNSS